MTDVQEAIVDWPEESREAAQAVIDKYGAPGEISQSMLVWQRPGPWKRIIAYRDYDTHDFPAPHYDSIECFLEYRVPTDMVSSVMEFDGSVVVNRTRGEISARCHDEEANNLALNLAQEVALGQRSVREARMYYAKEFIGYRKKAATPYMDTLFIEPVMDAADPDKRIIQEDELRQAEAAY